MAGLSVDEFLLLREAVDERCCRNEVGVGTLVESAATYRLDSRRLWCGAWGGAALPRPAFLVGDRDNNDATSVFNPSDMSDPTPRGNCKVGIKSLTNIYQSIVKG